MALPIEQITQRTEKAVVTMQSDVRDDAPAETMWASTTNFGTLEITLDDTVGEDQANRDEVAERLAQKRAGTWTEPGGGVE